MGVAEIDVMANSATTARQIVFISKATPGDDEFVLWLAPRLEAAGYKVFADILSLQAGDRWRKEVTGTLQNRAIKMLLCCRDSSLSKDGVQEEIGIALDVAKELGDARFIIPLRLEKFKKLFGIGELQYVDFLGSWAGGLRDLLETLEKQNVPRSSGEVVINPNWENYKKRLAITVEDSPEVLTANWLSISSVPDAISYYDPTGVIDRELLQRACQESPFPAQLHLHGFFSFASFEEVNAAFANVGRFALQSRHSLFEFMREGSGARSIKPREAQNLVSSMFRQSWETMCRERGLYEYAYSSQLGFHVTQNQVSIGRRIPWGRQEERRSSMLRNIAAGKVWQFGASASPHFWPFPHFRIKSRVLFSELAGKEAGAVFQDVDQQFRLRRTICKGWRNKAWHGRFMAFVEMLSAGQPYIELNLAGSARLRLNATPVRVTVPVTTALQDLMSEDAEEQDTSTLGSFDAEDAA